MYSTLLMIKDFINDELCAKTYNELSDIYKATQNQDVLASCFKKIYRLGEIIQHSRFWGIAQDDVESYCLESVAFCLNHYDVSKGTFTAFFSRYYGAILRNKSEWATRKMHGMEVLSYDSIIVNDDGENAAFLDRLGKEDTYNTYDMDLPSSLTERERCICDMLAAGYKQSEIAKIMGVTNQRVSQIKISIRDKFIPLQVG